MDTRNKKKNFDVEHSKNLENISWELNVQSSSSICSKECHVNTHLQMALISVDGKDKENVVLELDEQELTNLYNILENIQNKLDSI
jgi:hypothetical protein